MMKPPFKASDSAINVLRALWFDMCTVWFVGFIKLYKHDFEVMKYILCHAHLCNIRFIITSPSGLRARWL